MDTGDADRPDANGAAARGEADDTADANAIAAADRAERLDQALAPVREAYREWRMAYEVEAREAFAGLDEETRMKVTFHIFRMLATDVGTYRYLIYDKLGFDMGAYAVLFDGLHINNALGDAGRRRRVG